MRFLITMAAVCGLAMPLPAAAQTAFDGTWKSPSGALVTFKTGGGQLTMSVPSGAGYTAKLDGTEAPYLGEPSVDKVSVTMPDKSTLLEISKKDGVAWLEFRFVVDASGKGGKVSWKNLKSGKSGSYDVVKQ